MNTYTAKYKEIVDKDHQEIPERNSFANQSLETESYSLETIFDAPYRAPISTVWIAHFLGAAFLTGASWPAALSISSSKLSEALLPTSKIRKQAYYKR